MVIYQIVWKSLFFLNPANESEDIADSGGEICSETLLGPLIDEVSGADIYSDDQNDDSAEPAPLPNPQDTLNAVQTLVAYMEGRGESKTSLLRSLERVERDLEGEIITARAQGTLDSWLSNA